MTKLNYTTAAALIAAFKAGATFQVNDSGVVRDVTDITADTMTRTGAGFRVHTAKTYGLGWAYFGLDGVNTVDAAATLVQTSPVPLPFKTAQEVVDAFEAGAMFEVTGSMYGSNGPVTSMVTSGDAVGCRTVRGRNLFAASGRFTGFSNSNMRLVLVSPAPSKVPGFPYESVDALIADYEAGAKFEVVGASISAVNGAVLDVHKADTWDGSDGVSINGWHYNLKGEHAYGEAAPGRLVKTGDAPAPAKPAYDFPEIAWPVAAPAPEPEAFLKRFVTGEAAYCPATGEVVSDFTFECGKLSVEFRNEAGVFRESTSYRHDGTHKHDAKRDLVFGVPPKAEPKVKTYTVAELFESAPAGVYSIDVSSSRVVVIVHPDGESEPGDRVVLYFSGQTVQPLYRPRWERQSFTLTTKKFTGSIQ